MTIDGTDWRRGVYSGAAGGGVLWGIVTTVFVGLGTPGLSEQSEGSPALWAVSGVASVLVLAPAAILAVRWGTVRRRSAAVGVAVALLSGWLVIVWAATQFGAL